MVLSLGEEVRNGTYEIVDSNGYRRGVAYEHDGTFTLVVDGATLTGEYILNDLGEFVEKGGPFGPPY
jgi:hypothetical protein